jgi:xylulose-5-phosphate/fructose-6-phosphate phosphoketolase
LKGPFQVLSGIHPGQNGHAEISQGLFWPEGFPSHLYPGYPGVIHEGGELGYALATSYGAVLDNPRLIAACIVGDGEAETGPTAAAWHSTKFINPATDGAVLPILHLNGFKIANPTTFGSMDHDEIGALFWGYGFQTRFVEISDQPRHGCNRGPGVQRDLRAPGSRPER